MARARAKDSLRAFAKLTTVVDGARRIVSDPPLVVPVEELVTGDALAELDRFARTALRAYRRTLTSDRRRLLERYRYTHLARKVVGVGSVGTRAWVVLLLGRDEHDPLFLQLKEAQASALEPFLGASRFANHAQRVVEGQRLTQAASDVLLGWVRLTGLDGLSRDFYVRQLWDAKGSALVERMDPPTMTLYAQLCGQTLARAHARSGDAVAIAACLGAGDRFDRALAAFTHIKEAWARTHDNTQAVVTGIATTGRVITSAALIMVSVFFAFIINGDPTVKQSASGWAWPWRSTPRSCAACWCPP